MAAYTADELFAREYSKKSGFSENSLRMVASSFDRGKKRLDYRAFNSGIPADLHNRIINDYLQYVRELSQNEKYTVKKRAGNHLILAEDRESMDKRIALEIRKKEIIHPLLEEIAFDYVKSLDYRPDLAYIVGSASMKSENPFFYAEDDNDVYCFSDLDIAMVYPSMNDEISNHLVKQTKWKQRSKNVAIKPWHISYKQMNQRLAKGELVYGAHMFEDVDKENFWFNGENFTGIRLY